MPRDITYSKLRQESPGTAHLQNTTEVVESTFPVGVKLYSLDIPPSGTRGELMYMNLLVERKGYNLPIHISVGIGTSPANFRPIAVYRNVDPENNTLFPIQFNIPIDLDLGKYIMWYKVEPVVPELTKSPRLEVLTYSPVSSEVQTLEVVSSTVDLTLDFNVQPDNVSVYNSSTNTLLYTLNNPALHTVAPIDVGAGVNVYIHIVKNGYYSITDYFYLASNLSKSYSLGAVLNVSSYNFTKNVGTTTMTSSQSTLVVLHTLVVNYSRALTSGEIESEKAAYIALLNSSALYVNFGGNTTNLPSFTKNSTFVSNTSTSITYSISITFNRTSTGSTNTTVITGVNGSGVTTNNAVYNLIIDSSVVNQGTPLIVNLGTLDKSMDQYTSSKLYDIQVRYPAGSSWVTDPYNLLSLTNIDGTVPTNFTVSLDSTITAGQPVNEFILRVRLSRINEYSEGMVVLILSFYNSVTNGFFTQSINFNVAHHVNAVTYVSQNVNVAETKKGMFYYYTDVAQGMIELQPMNYISNTNAIGDGFRNNMNNVNMYNRAALGGPFFHTLYFDPINIPKEPLSVKLTIPIPSGTYIALSADTYNGLTANKDVYGMKVMIPTQSRQILTFNGNPNILTNALSPRLNGATNPNGVDYLDLNADIRNNIGGRVTVDLLPSVVNRTALSQGLVITVMYSTTYKLAINSGNTQSGFNSVMGQFRGTSVLPSIPINMPFATSQYGEYKIEVNL